MESGSGGDRQEERVCSSDDMENSKKPMGENVPKILSPEIHDVFHIFASMLDVKSFMNLAMTSKEMYNRCTENKSIKIDVEADWLILENAYGSLVFNWQSSEDEDVVALRKVPRKVLINEIEFANDIEDNDMPAIRNRMNEIGVNKISSFSIYAAITEWETVFAIIKDFKVDSLQIFEHVELDILRSMLKLNMNLFNNTKTVPIDFILEIESTIPVIYFQGVRLTKNELIEILHKVQSGSIVRLGVHERAVNWNEFDMLPFDHQGPLPEHRPLLLARTSQDDQIDEYWFLHSNGITKCVTDSSELETVIFKCEPNDYPWILRKEEDVLKALTAKHPRVSCTEEQFHTFFKSLTMLDPSHEGPLPKDRPIYCSGNEHCFWMLDENENLTSCKWEHGTAFWARPDPDDFPPIEHPAVAKHIFWHWIKQFDWFWSGYHFDNKEFKGVDLFADCKQLDFDYSGPLPNARPLVFKWTPRDEIDDNKSWRHKSLRVILLDDRRILECAISENNDGDDDIEMQLCEYVDLPPILFTAKHVVEMLKEQYRDIDIHLRDIISEKAETEFWFMHDDVVRKVEWKLGRLSNNEADLSESPQNFMKKVFRHFAMKESEKFIKLELEQFRNCLEQFIVVSFDYCGPLKTDSPLAFVKNEIRHTCRTGATGRRCNCAESSIFVWFMWDAVRVTCCSWGKGEPKNVVFGKDRSSNFNDVPVAMKSKEYLENLFQAE